MRTDLACLLLAAATVPTGAIGTANAAESAAPAANPPFGLVIHGGAGVITREKLSPELEAEYRATMAAALNAGYAVLDRGGTSLEAVAATIIVLEDSPLFNAGRGAVFSADGVCELDASIMDGRTLAAGAVAGVRHIKNPILLARDVMEKSGHVLLTGEGAERFAVTLDYEMMTNEYFQTGRRREEWEKAKEAVRGRQPAATSLELAPDALAQQIWSTVGCVALDRAGNLAAGTSTGGMTNKKWGRVGDSPIIGAGTYAKNATCAVSATGWGEFFIRLSVAHDVSAQIEYRGTPLAEAAAATLEKVRQLGATGGLIAIDRAGNVAMPFNTAGMYRGFRLSTGAGAVEIFGESPAK
jgi:L-asparaginase / beta-aspartyl-peptidase